MVNVLKLGRESRKWWAKLLILKALVKGEDRGFNEIQRDTNLSSPNAVSNNLKTLTRLGFVNMLKDGRYRITDSGIDYLYFLEKKVESSETRGKEMVFPFHTNNLTGNVYVALVEGAPTPNMATEERIKNHLVKVCNAPLNVVTNLIPEENIQEITFNVYFRKGKREITA